MTLPKEARLRLGYQYEFVRNKGHIVHGPLFRLACAPAPDSLSTACGMIVSRRVGGAVIRNKVKRRLRNLYRLDRAIIAPSLWLVIIASPKAAAASMADLRAEWLRLSNKLSIFRVS